MCVRGRCVVSVAGGALSVLPPTSPIHLPAPSSRRIVGTSCAAGWGGLSLGPASTELASVVHGAPAPTAPAALPRREGAGVRVCVREVTAATLGVCVRVCVSEWAGTRALGILGSLGGGEGVLWAGREREGRAGSVGRGIPGGGKSVTPASQTVCVGCGGVGPAARVVS